MRAVRWATTTVLVAAVAVAVAVVLLPSIGLRPLVVSSGSMQPALMTGDAIVSRVVSPADVGAGAIVTFTDPTGDKGLITHRVVERTVEGRRYSFVTKGDANTGVEQWSVGASAKIGVLALRVPRLGYAVGAASSPVTRIGGLVVAFGLVMRRIWA